MSSSERQPGSIARHRRTRATTLAHAPAVALVRVGKHRAVVDLSSVVDDHHVHVARQPKLALVLQALPVLHKRCQRLSMWTRAGRHQMQHLVEHHSRRLWTHLRNGTANRQATMETDGGTPASRRPNSVEELQLHEPRTAAIPPRRARPYTAKDLEKWRVAIAARGIRRTKGSTLERALGHTVGTT